MKTDQNEATETEAERLYREEEERDAIAYAKLKREQEIWAEMRTQQVMSFSERLPRTPDYDMNDWLMKNSNWRIKEMTSATSREIGDYDAIWTTQTITCLMEKVR